MDISKYDREYYEAMKDAINGPPVPTFTNALDLRNFANSVLPFQMAGYSPNEDIETTIISIKGGDGHEILITLFTSPKALASNESQPAILYIHGGATIAGSVAAFAPLIRNYAALSGFPIFAVDYRLAPEHKAPAGLEDCYAALVHMSSEAKTYGINPSTIGVMGDSAGGLLAASVVLTARDRKLDPPIAKQILIYPQLDDQISIAGGDPINKYFKFRASDAILAWDAYLGKGGRENITENVVPARVEDLSNLPPAYIEVGTLDLFLEEDVKYAQRLIEEHVETELHVWPGLPHGWEVAQNISWFGRAMESRLSAIASIGL